MDAILQGRDHPELGEVAVVAPHPDLALGMTRGLHPKLYSYVDPNEDVVAVVREGPVTGLVVADGHNGHEGSHAAVAGLLDALATPLPAALDRRAAATALHAAGEHLRSVRRALRPPNRGTRTTLVLGLVTANGEGEGSLVTASVGDSAVMVVRSGRAEQVTKDRHRFLGDRLSLPEVAGSMHYAVTPLLAGDLVVAVSDGFTNFAAIDEVGPAVTGLDPEAATRALIDLAGANGAGDNVCAAVHHFSGDS